MNSLSWLIYLAEVIPQLGGYIFAVGLITGIGWLGLNFITTVARSFHNDEADLYRSSDPNGKGKRQNHGFVLPWLVAFPLVLMTLAMLVPTRQTLLLIAGSEMGQKVIENPGTQEILGDVKDIISKELKRIKDGK